MKCVLKRNYAELLVQTSLPPVLHAQRHKKIERVDLGFNTNVTMQKQTPADVITSRG